MRWLKIALFADCLAILSPLCAQSPAYHVELSEGTSGQIILENGSSEDIEAFHLSGHCGTTSQYLTRDILDSPSDVLMLATSPYKNRRGGVHAWESETFRDQLMPQPSGCDWNVAIDAVLYTDGTYEGDKAQARSLQARRDGIAATVRYWMDRLKTLPTSPKELASIRTDADRRSRGGSCTQPTPDCGYQQGRRQVDSNLAERLEHLKDTPDMAYEQALAFLTQWQKELDGNFALKRLDATFPLSAALVKRQPEVAATPLATSCGRAVVGIAP